MLFGAHSPPTRRGSCFMPRGTARTHLTTDAAILPTPRPLPSIEPGRTRMGDTINNLNKFLWASVRRCFRKFLKNTGRFQPCPLDVLKSFSKTQGGFRAARWMLFVAGRFRLSADSRFRFRLFASTTLNHKTQNRFPFNWRHKPFLRLRCFVVRIFSCLRTKNGF